MGTLDLKRDPSAKRVERLTNVLKVGLVSIDVRALDHSGWGHCSGFGSMVAELARLKRMGSGATTR